MRTFTRFSFAAALAGAALPGLGAVTAQDAWVRGTVPGQDTSGAYMKLVSTSNVALVRAESPASKAVELHSMRMEGGVMKMRNEPRLELSAGKTIELAPSGLHLMLVGVSRPLKPGETVPLKLTFETQNGSSEVVEVSAKVQPLNATSAKGAPGHDMAGHMH